jgi:hypothetical protein
MCDEQGTRLSNAQLYGGLPVGQFVELMHTLICESNAEVVTVHGGPARRALKKRLGMEPDRKGAGNNYEIVDMVIGGKQVSSSENLNPKNE